MQIEKRDFPKYVLLNCLTLGIYGFLVSMKMEKEINEICKGDGEQPHFSYVVASLFRAIPALLGVILGLIGGASIFRNDLMRLFFGGFAGDILEEFLDIGSYMYYGYGESVKAQMIMSSMAVNGLLFSVIGSIFSGLYLRYWWYKQASRLKLNGYRYGLEIKESGADNLLAHTVLELGFIPVTIMLILASAFIPLLLYVIFVKAEVEIMASLIFLIISLILMFFGMEITFGANFAKMFLFKNINRFADVSVNAVKPYDPMGYENYPCIESKYPNFVPKLTDGTFQNVTNFKADNFQQNAGGAKSNASYSGSVNKGANNSKSSTMAGKVIGINGTCAGYQFKLNPGDEIIIGKDAQVSSVIIDASFKQVSRKHVSISYDAASKKYRVVDFSSNGTFANGERLVPGQENYLYSGTILELVDKKNTFKLD